jgi:hypothetical protein
MLKGVATLISALSSLLMFNQAETINSSSFTLKFFFGIFLFGLETQGRTTTGDGCTSDGYNCNECTSCGILRSSKDMSSTASVTMLVQIPPFDIANKPTNKL